MISIIAGKIKQDIIKKITVVVIENSVTYISFVPMNQSNLPKPNVNNVW